jgi:hypothetical protein
MKGTSAKANIIPSLVMMGIIDSEGKPTERATSWRDDQQYVEVCREIRSECYPQELLDAAPGPTVDRALVERWFANRTGAGTVAVRRFSLVYEFLTTATVPGKQVRPATRAKPRRPAKQEAAQGIPGESVPAAEAGQVLQDLVPSVHIDIQIHISPDAKAEQIDHIFASIAKHLRKQHE